MALLSTKAFGMQKYQLYAHSICQIAMSWSWQMTSQTYDWILTQLVGGFEFVMRDDGSGICLKMRTIGAISERIDLIDIYWAKTSIY